MSLSLKWCAVWALILAVALWQNPALKRAHLLMAPVHEIRVGTWQAELRAGHWQTAAGLKLDDAAITQWLQNLDRDCRPGYAEEAVQKPPHAAALPFTLNGVRFVFGSINAYNAQTYLYHHGRAWLCPPLLRLHLERAENLWKLNHARTPRS